MLDGPQIQWRGDPGPDGRIHISTAGTYDLRECPPHTILLSGTPTDCGSEVLEVCSLQYSVISCNDMY